MVTAFILVNVEEQKLNGLADKLLELEGIKEVHVVAGEYDMVAVARVANNQVLAHLLTDRVLHTPGIQRTKTLISLHAHSQYDLAQVFN